MHAHRSRLGLSPVVSAARRGLARGRSPRRPHRRGRGRGGGEAVRRRSGKRGQSRGGTLPREFSGFVTFQGFTRRKIFLLVRRGDESSPTALLCGTLRD